MNRSRLRLLAAVTAALFALVPLSACANSTRTAEDRVYVIAGGGATGVYYNYGLQLAKVLTRDLGVEVEVEETDGSVDNLRRIGAGEALFGFAQGDTTADAVIGVGSFDERLPVKAMARLYDEYVHVVVRADSEIEQLADFTGRSVSLGARGSGVNVVATRVLSAVSVAPSSIDNRELGVGASIEALKNGEIEGFFWVGGLPTPGIDQLAEDIDIRLLPIDAETVNQINSLHAGVYRVADLPAGAYGRSEPTQTMTVPNYLVAAEGTPDSVVYEVLQVLFDSRTQIAQQVRAAALLDRRQAIFTDPVPLHPGASSYYSSTKR